MFIFKGPKGDPEASKAALERELKAVGIMAPFVRISGTGENHMLVVKTYITKERIAMEMNFSGEGRFKISQQMWLTPEMEATMERLRARRGKDNG